MVTVSAKFLIDNNDKAQARIKAILKDLNRALMKTSMENNVHG